MKESVFEGLSEHFKGATAVATTENDVVALAKAVNNFLKDNPGANLKGAILDGKAVTLGEFKIIAELPSREVLIGKLLYLMHTRSPDSRWPWRPSASRRKARPRPALHQPRTHPTRFERRISWLSPLTR